MKIATVAAVILSVCAAFSAVGCAGGKIDDKKVNTAAVSDVKDYSGMTLLNAFAAEKGGAYTAFAEGLDEDKYMRAEYQVFGEASETYGTEDKALISELYGALSEVKLESLYDEDVMFADAGDAFFFYDDKNEYVAFHFDFGKASIGKRLYNCADKKKLNSVKNRFRELYEE